MHGSMYSASRVCETSEVLNKCYFPFIAPSFFSVFRYRKALCLYSQSFFMTHKSDVDIHARNDYMSLTLS